MVRREGTGSAPIGAPPVPEGASPAGESPAPVSAGAPGSRPQAGGETPLSRAGRQEPLRREQIPPRGEQVRGPQLEVNPAASSEKQRGSRAAHFAAKAMFAAARTGRESAVGPSGVGGAARVQGSGRNRRGPSARPESRRGDPYKPSAKAGAVQRESEGIVVPVMAATNNATGGKGPWDEGAVSGGTREGMAGKTGPNNPGGREPDDKVRGLQRLMAPLGN